ncbi:phosphotransferase enzyme family protein [Streptomyces sp. NBC_01506]|uniref:phosphotransferase enzyme family protein n=1 Tax=Streptomyces sp. NBC_01506 TaxID=2903887 RepID=UPI003867CDE5
MDRESLQDGPRPVVRIGDTVHRPVQPWTPAVHALLRHLEAVGFPYSPRVLGFDGEGREVLTFIDGESGPAVWAKIVSDDGLAAFARLLRAYHDACAGFVPPAGTEWCTGVGAPAAGQIVCHGDFAPWNTVWDGDRPVGILDWDFARPAARIHDVAYALEYVAPFRDDKECVRWLRYPEPPDRRRRLELFCDVYGLGRADRPASGMVDAVIAAQLDTAALVRQLACRGLEPQATWVAEGHLAVLAGRVEWSRAHRSLFR